MALVKGPNGQVLDVSDVTASGLVGDGSRGWERVEDKPKRQKRTQSSDSE